MKLTPLGKTVLAALVLVPFWFWLDAPVLRFFTSLSLSPIDVMILISLLFVALLVLCTNARRSPKGHS